MAIRVPPDQVEAIKKWLALTNDKRSEFSSALAQAKPHFNRYDLAAEVATAVELPKPLVQGIVDVLVSLYLTRDADHDIAAFVERSVYTALQRAGLFLGDADQGDWQQLVELLRGAIANDRVIGTAAKSGRVLTEHAKVFSEASIVTDFRPIFHSDVSEKPDVGYVVHTLRVRYRNTLHQDSEVFLALDRNDLGSLIKTLERAIKKEATIESVLANAGVTIETPGAVY